MPQVIEVILPALHTKQAAFVNDSHRYTLIESGTKSGKTMGLSWWTVKNAMERQRSTWWWTAPVFQQVKIGFGRCVDLIPPSEREVNHTDLIIKLTNGSTIQGRSGEKPDNLFGAEVHGAIIDEASRFREESFQALRTTLTRTKGPMKICGNPKGKKNWFYRLCQKAKDPSESEYSYHHLTSTDNPFIDRKEIEDARELLPRAVFDELYMGIAQDDNTGVFRTLQYDCELSNYVAGKIYFIGYDPARTQDNAALYVLESNGTERYLRHCETLPQASWNQQLERVVYLANHYQAGVTMDSTGLGDPLFEQLSNKGIRVESFKFTNESKQQLIENLAVDIEHQRVHAPDPRMNPEVAALAAELDMFEYNVLRSGKVQYNAPAGFHDDRVIGLALANWAVNHAYQPIRRPEGNYGIDLV